MCVNNWNDARILIEKEVNANDDLNTPRSTFRKVLKKSQKEIRVQKGISKNSSVDVSYERLEILWNELRCCGRFNTEIFIKHFKADYKNATCWTGIVGEIFVKAGLAIRVSDYPLDYRAACLRYSELQAFVSVDVYLGGRHPGLPLRI